MATALATERNATLQFLPRFLSPHPDLGMRTLGGLVLGQKVEKYSTPQTNIVN